MTSAEASATTGVLGYFVRHRTAANLLLVTMLIGGIYAAMNIRFQFFPDVVRESATVTVDWDAAGPEEVDRGIVALLEPELITIEGVDEIVSISREGRARVTLSFEPGWNMDRATNEVQAAVDGIRNLPDSADPPEVRRGAFRDLVTDVVIHGPVSETQLGRFADELRARLFQAGAGKVSIRGVRDPVIRVSASEADLIRHDVRLSEIAAAISAETEARPSGDIQGGASRVLAGRERRTPSELGEIVLRHSMQGGDLTVRDVALVAREGAEEGIAYYHGDNPAVVVRVQRGAGGDAVAMQALVEDIAAEMRPTLPAGVEIQLTRTRAQAISDRLDILLSNGAVGLGLVLVFLFLFLSARTAFWVAVGIPAAMAATVALIYLFGMTLNMVSLFALIICLGIVVDDAIVVGEHADHLAGQGASPAEAAARAARRMAGPVFAASVTTIIAFGGLVLIGGRFGSLILAIPVTVGLVLIASLVESFLILPAHMRHALSASRKSPWYDAPSRWFNMHFARFRDGPFRVLITQVIRHRYAVLIGVVALLIWSATLFVEKEVRWRFFNAPERSTISANIAMTSGAARSDTREMLKELRRALEAVDARFEAEHGRAPLVFSLSTIGAGSSARALNVEDDKDRDLLGGFSIELIDSDERPYPASDFIKAWRAEIKRPPNLEILALRGARSGPGGEGISVRMHGADPKVLKAAAEDLKTQLEAFSAVSGLEDSLTFDKSEIQLTLTPLGEALGFDTDALGTELRARLSGVTAAEFADGPRTATVKVRLDEDELSAAYLHEARLRAPDGGYVRLADIVNMETRLGFASIRRENGLRIVTVTGDLSEDDPEAAAEVSDALRGAILPDVEGRYGVTADLGGLAEQEREFLSDALVGFGLCLLGIYAALAWIFGSWARPIVVMAVIPFGVIGMIWGHYWHGVPLSMFSVVGGIGMAGIIINDSIVLVTTVDGHANRRAMIPSLIDGVCERLRPVLLTTLTTVFGLAPLLFETSRQAQFLKPTVITLAYGLGFGVVLVLLVTPALVAVQRDTGAVLTSARRLSSLWVRRLRAG